MTTALRPLSTGELLDRTFSLYRSHFALFVGIVALPHLIILTFQCMAIAFQPTVREGFSAVAVFTTMFWALGAALLSLVVSSTSQAATVVAVSNVYLDRPASIMDSFSRVKYQIIGVIGLSLAMGFLVGLACLALIVPGMLLMVRWSLAIPAKVLEDKGVSAALTRSSELTQGNRGRVFVVWLLFITLSIGVSLLLQWPIEMAAGASSLAGIQRADAMWRVASLVATFVAQCLVGPLATIAFSLLYYDERVRKEAFDLQLMMTTLDAPALQVSPA